MPDRVMLRADIVERILKLLLGRSLITYGTGKPTAPALLRTAAAEIVEPKEPSMQPMIDVDELLAYWMELWGSWDPRTSLQTREMPRPARRRIGAAATPSPYPRGVTAHHSLPLPSRCHCPPLPNCHLPTVCHLLTHPPPSQPCAHPLVHAYIRQSRTAHVLPCHCRNDYPNPHSLPCRGWFQLRLSAR